MRQKVGVVIDPWDYPYNGTVVSTRRFVSALEDQIDFRLLATPGTPVASQEADPRIYAFPKLKIPLVNGLIEKMKVPLANPWRGDVAASLRGLDLVHMQFPFFLGARVCREAKRQGLPLICSFHVQPENLLRNLNLNSPILAKWLYKLFIWAMYKHADLVLTPSKFAADQLKAAGLRQPTEVLSNGVPEVFFQQPRSVNQAAKHQILSVGRFAPEKHHELIFEAIAQSKFRDQIHLRVVGAGPLEQELKDAIQRLGIDAEIDTASDDELLRAYSQSDLFVHAGEIELEGMSVLEAMATGNPVLISDSENSAAVEFVDHPKARFASHSSQDLAAKIDYWLGNPEVRVQAGVENRERARQRHHDNSVAQLKSIYDRMQSSGCRTK